MGIGANTNRAGRRFALMRCIMALPLAAGILAATPEARANDAPSASPTSPILKMEPLDQHPTAVAVDAQRHRVFVASIGPEHGTLRYPDLPAGPGTIRIFDSVTGGLIKTVMVGMRPVLLTVAERAGRVFVLNEGNPAKPASTLTVLDSATGAVIATVPIAGERIFVNLTPLGLDAISSIAVAVDERDNHLFVATNAVATSARPSLLGQVSMRDARTGALLGTTTVGVLPDAMAVDPVTDHIFVTNAGGQGTCAATPDCPSTVSVLDGQSGRLLATTVLPSSVGNAPGGETAACAALADAQRQRLVVVSTGDGRYSGRISVLDTRAGSLISAHDAGYVGCRGQVDQRTGQTFVLTTPYYQDPATSPTGAIVVRTTTGAVIGQTAATARVSTLSVDEQNGRLFLAGAGQSGGSVSAVDGMSYAVLWRISTVTPPVALAADGRTGHLFVAVPSNSHSGPGTLLMVDANARPAAPPVGHAG